MLKKCCIAVGLFILLFINAYGAEEEIQVSPVTYSKGGSRIYTITAGTTVTANVNVTNNTGENKQVVLSMVLFKDDIMIDVSTQAKEAPPGLSSYSTSMMMPPDITGCEINTIVWSSFDNMKPLCSVSKFPSSDCSLKGIMVDGTYIENFDKNKTEYKITINPYRENYPDVKPIPFDNSATLVETNPVYFPGEYRVLVTAADGETSKEYKIRYESNTDDLVSNLQYLGPTTNGAAEYKSRPAIGYDFNEGSLLYTDRPKYFARDINPSIGIIGSTYIVSCLEYYSASGDYEFVKNAWRDADNIIDWFSFDIKRTAEIILLSEGASSFAVFTTPGNGWTRSNAPADSPYYIRDLADGRAYAANAMAVKRFTVEPGETGTVKLQNAGNNAVPYIAFIKFPYANADGGSGDGGG